jgi:hypothetical protein
MLCLHPHPVNAAAGIYEMTSSASRRRDGVLLCLRGRSAKTQTPVLAGAVRRGVLGGRHPLVRLDVAYRPKNPRVPRQRFFRAHVRRDRAGCIQPGRHAVQCACRASQFGRNQREIIYGACRVGTNKRALASLIQALASILVNYSKSHQLDTPCPTRDATLCA